MGNSLPNKKVSGRWKHLIICPNRTLFHGLTAILAEVTPGSTFTDLKAYPARRALTEAVNSERPNLCFLDVGTSWDSAVALMNELNSVSASMPVVAISASTDPDLILRSLRQGASEFLFQPFAIDQVGAALDRLARIKLAANIQSSDMGKVYCIMPGKGACGATTLAFNLAFQLQRLNTAKKVLLADLDPATGTLSFVLKLKSSYSFVDALTHSSQMDEDLWRALVTQQQGVDVILSPENPVETIQTQEAAAMIEYSRENYGAVILDTAGPYGSWVEEIAKLCDELLLVTTNELPALHSTQRAIAHLERNGIERSKIKLVVNRFNSDLGLDRTAIQTALNLDVFQLLPNDTDTIQKSLLEGKPVAASTVLGKHFVNMAERLGGREADAKRRKPLLSGIFSIFEGVLHKG
jgi:pilus assembly protein CpaE